MSSFEPLMPFPNLKVRNDAIKKCAANQLCHFLDKSFYLPILSRKMISDIIWIQMPHSGQQKTDLQKQNMQEKKITAGGATTFTHYLRVMYLNNKSLYEI